MEPCINDIFLSFIIPLYNCESYITTCLGSIKSAVNEKKDIELIIVNDGSIDDGEARCRDFCRDMANVRIITQQNKGASTARNTGLSLAKGRYIWFVDADDRILPESFNSIYTYLKKNTPEVLVFNYIEEWSTDYREVKSFVECGPVDTGDYCRQNRGLFLWNKIFSRPIIGSTRFLDGTKNIEDFLFNIEVLVKTDNIHALDCAGYAYNLTNIDSTSRSKSLRNLVKLSKDSLLVHGRIQQMLPELSGAKKELVTDLLSFSIGGHLYSLLKYYNCKRFYKITALYSRMGLFPVKPTSHPRMNRFLTLSQMLWHFRWLIPGYYHSCR